VPVHSTASVAKFIPTRQMKSKLKTLLNRLNNTPCKREACMMLMCVCLFVTSALQIKVSDAKALNRVNGTEVPTLGLRVGMHTAAALTGILLGVWGVLSRKLGKEEASLQLGFQPVNEWFFKRRTHRAIVWGTLEKRYKYPDGHIPRWYEAIVFDDGSCRSMMVGNPLIENVTHYMEPLPPSS
jgi:hypothetical protein